MIGLLSKVIIIDNSGGLIGRCIKVLKPGIKPKGLIGDVIIVSVIKTSSGSLIQKGDIHKALIVRTIKLYNNVKWSTNAVVLIKGNDKSDYQPVGTRIKAGGPISKNLNSLKIVTLAKFLF
jgi:large subunit ribosomal protein L14